MAQDKKEIAFVVYPGCTLLELVGAYDILKRATMMSPFRVVAVGERIVAVDSDTPMALVPQKTFAEAPHPYGIIVVGSRTRALTALQNRALLDYLRSAGETAELVGAVSSGSLVLAEAGLLRGRQATTHWACAGKLEELGVRYVRQAWLEDGKFITAAGVSGAIDVALHIGAKLTNQARAQQAQLFSEYDPQPPFGGIDWSRVNGNGSQPGTTPASERAPEKTIALVMYNGLTVFDLVGPLQVYTELARIDPCFRVTVVSERVEPLQTDMGVKMIPNQTFDQVPHPDIVVVPGGGEPTLRAMVNPAIRAYVRSAAQTAEVVGSVCTGALILAGVGLLEGRPATTHWSFYQVLDRLGARYQRKRWVEDGKFIMSAGVSAGTDASLYLASRLAGQETARRIQRDIQYDPQPPFGGIDWDHLGVLPRLVRVYFSARAPFIARRARRLTRQGQ
jgi:transcriptional regulator GlxA family with amidase domain